MANIVISNAQELYAIKDNALGETPWLRITQERINQFAQATNDHQWIHVDTEKANKGPFGVTIAHGYLTLSLVTYFLEELIEFKKLKMGVNYGCDKVRFPAPVLVDSNVRGKGEIIKIEEKDNVLHVITRVTVEVEGNNKPACVADILSRLVFID
ncbi:TPA: MaoC family dehydratase [Photobacterium damselae]